MNNFCKICLSVVFCASVVAVGATFLHKEIYLNVKKHPVHVNKTQATKALNSVKNLENVDTDDLSTLDPEDFKKIQKDVKALTATLATTVNKQLQKIGMGD
jgi:hypothetical protein